MSLPSRKASVFDHLLRKSSQLHFPNEKVNNEEIISRSTKVGDLLRTVVEDTRELNTKITIVGCGQVGTATAFSILFQNLTNELCLIGRDERMVLGHVLDLQHGSTLTESCKITGGTDYALTANSTLCIITVGAKQEKVATRLSMLQKNLQIIRDVVPKLVKHSPNTILLVVTNPVDVLSYVAWKVSGLPIERVLGSGTHLDSVRFRFLLSERLGIAPSACHGWIIGEHGESCVAVWSGVNVAGVPLVDINPEIGQTDDIDKWEIIHKEVVEGGYKVFKLKGYTNWAVALSVTSICASILGNRRQILAVSTNVKGLHGIDFDVFLSLPCVLDGRGVTNIIQQNLSDPELEKLKQSAQIVGEALKNIEL